MSLEHVEKLIKDHKVDSSTSVRRHARRAAPRDVPQVDRRAEPVRGRQDVRRQLDLGWKGINESDMVLLPIATTAFLDPFTADPDARADCDILDPATMQAYARDPRGVAKRAEAFLKSSGIADQAFFGPDRNSSSSTASASRTTWATPSSTSIRKKRTGTRAANTKAATPATARW
jgi:glutamine synthetase